MVSLEPMLREGAIYSGDRGRLMCCACAGALAYRTGMDSSGAYVARLDVFAVADLVPYGGTVSCACGKVTVTATPDPEGWPVRRGGSR